MVKLSLANTTAYRAAEQGSAPGSPATGFAIIYPKSDGRWYQKDDAGIERLLAGPADAPAAHTHPAADIASGVLAIGRLATGTPDGTKFVRDDGTLAVPPGTGFANPMTAQDDLIIGGVSGAAARLAKGTDGQVLTVDPTTHHLIWATPASGGMANPMTTAGDIIVGGASGAPARLAAGTNGHVLTLASGTPAWQAPSGGGTAYYPTEAAIWHIVSKVTTGNGLATAADSNQTFNNYSYQNTAANGDVFQDTVMLKAGTYTFKSLGLTGPSRGNVAWTLDGNAVATHDYYDAAGAYNTVRTTTGVVVTGSGRHLLVGTVGKNASSSGYQVPLTLMWFQLEATLTAENS